MLLPMEDNHKQLCANHNSTNSNLSLLTHPPTRESNGRVVKSVTRTRIMGFKLFYKQIKPYLQTKQRNMFRHYLPTIIIIPLCVGYICSEEWFRSNWFFLRFCSQYIKWIFINASYLYCNVYFHISAGKIFPIIKFKYVLTIDEQQRLWLC
jgi:hypothetical protein